MNPSFSLQCTRSFCASLVVGCSIFFAPLIPHAAPVTVSVSVPGTSDPWLAGMPNGSTASGSDTAPLHSPIQVAGLNLELGSILTFGNATGGVSNGGGCPPACAAIDGAGFTSHSAGPQNGISNITAPISSLLGLFLDDAPPNLSAAAGALNYQTLGLDFLSLSPLLKQVFFIGDGETSAADTQQFIIPTGATRLFLGTMDGFGWFNNTGAINVDVTLLNAQIPNGIPEPGTLALLAIPMTGLHLARKRR